MCKKLKRETEWSKFITWRHISQVVFPFSLHHLCMQSLWANWTNRNALIYENWEDSRNHYSKKKKRLWKLLKKLYVFTLTVPEQAQGASKLFELSNSSSWHILQREIPESNFKSSTSKTTSAIFSFFLTPNEMMNDLFSSNSSFCFFKFWPVLCFPPSVFCSLFLCLSQESVLYIYERKKERNIEFQYCPCMIFQGKKLNFNMT